MIFLCPTLTYGEGRGPGVGIGLNCQKNYPWGLYTLKPGGYSPGKGILLLGRHCGTLTLTGTKAKKAIPLLVHRFENHTLSGTEIAKSRPYPS